MRYILIALGTGLCANVFAQSLERTVIAGSGGLHDQLEWTVGETVIHTATDATGTLTQGFIQGDLNITAIDEVGHSPIIVFVYPNPFMDAIVISHNIMDGTDIPITLVDMGGKTVLSTIIRGPQQTVDVSDLAAGIYFLRVQVNGNENRMYQLVKMK
jgi:hypothetical protein